MQYFWECCPCVCMNWSKTDVTSNWLTKWFKWSKDRLRHHASISWSSWSVFVSLCESTLFYFENEHTCIFLTWALSHLTWLIFELLFLILGSISKWLWWIESPLLLGKQMFQFSLNLLIGTELFYKETKHSCLCKKHSCKTERDLIIWNDPGCKNIRLSSKYWFKKKLALKKVICFKCMILTWSLFILFFYCDPEKF